MAPRQRLFLMYNPLDKRLGYSNALETGAAGEAGCLRLETWSIFPGNCLLLNQCSDSFDMIVNIGLKQRKRMWAGTARIGADDN
jgi:hypothetical protein